MFPKMDLRKKAMAAMLKEGASQMMKKKPSSAVPGMSGNPMKSGEQGMGEEELESPEVEQKEGDGFEQMMVSPEEKEMIMKARGEPSEGSHEMPHGQSGFMSKKPKGM